MNGPGHMVRALLWAALLAASATGVGAQEKKGEVVVPPPPMPVTNLSVVKDAVKDTVKGALTAAAAKVAGGATVPSASTPAPAVAVPVPPVPTAAAIPQPAVLPLDPAQRLAFLRRKVLKDEDFADNDEINRDPFRSYLRVFIEKPAARVHTVPAICDKFALEELTLIAIVSGDANPRAMFRDPLAVGYTVKRGDFVSKNSARITKILGDRVIFEMATLLPGGESHTTEKAVFVNPEGAK